jgi:hypothetical protein
MDYGFHFEAASELEGAFDYLVYQIGNDRIAIIAVMHLHQRPGYWRERET